ncbi:hypothetical protein [Sphingomonas sp. SRS2]|nr:hypothetical protein [Sphingomonas sp. SRS2]
MAEPFVYTANPGRVIFGEGPRPPEADALRTLIARAWAGDPPAA